MIDRDDVVIAIGRVCTRAERLTMPASRASIETIVGEAWILYYKFERAVSDLRSPAR